MFAVVNSATNPLRRSPAPCTAALAVALALLLPLAGCGKKSGGAPMGGPGGPQGPMPVTLQTVTPTDAPILIEIPAQVEGSSEFEVRARVTGTLEKQLYAEGTYIQAGAPMFQIERRTYEIALADAQAQQEQTSSSFQRYEKLLPEGAVSQKEYDDAKLAKERAEAALKQAQLNLSYTIVTAPESGFAGRAVLSVGALVSASNNLLTSVVQFNPAWVRFGLGDSELAQLPLGAITELNGKSVDVVMPDGSVYAHKGRVNFRARELAANLGTLELRAQLPNPQGKLLPGQFVRVRLYGGMRHGVYLVPQAAVLQSDQGYAVYVMDDDGKAALRPIKVGEWQGVNWVVLSGLKPGDRVVTDNLIKLRPGASITAAPPPAASSGMTSNSAR